MQNLLPPSLQCEQNSDKNIWVSEVIPAFKVRPCPEDDYFAGYQLMIFAKKTRKNVVYDAQVNLGWFYRTGNFTCRTGCSKAFGCLGAARLKQKNNFLAKCVRDNNSLSPLSIIFFEDGKCYLDVDSFCFCDDGEFQIICEFARGYDFNHRNEMEIIEDTHCNISLVFNESGKSLIIWMRKVNNV